MARITIEVSEKGIKEAERELKKLGATGSKTQVSMSGVGSAARTTGTAVVAATAAIVGFSSVMASNAIQLQKNATNAKLTTSEFQNMALAAGTVGLNVDQVGSILADTQEKIGDFLATGGGAFMDFVDVMGLTEAQAIKVAKEFEAMSGRDVLLAMTSQMQAAGVSTQRMSFALEGMASDSRDLIPLLVNNGVGLKDLEFRFSSISTTINDETIKSMNELSTVSLVVAKNMGNTLATALAGVSDYLISAGENAAFFWASLQSGTVQQLTSDMAKVNDEIQSIERSLASGIIQGGYNTTAEQAVKNAESRLSGLKAEYKALNDQYQKMYGVSPVTPESPKITRDVKLVTDTTTKSTLELKKEAELKRTEDMAQESINKQVEALQQQYASEEEILNQRLELIKKSDLDILDQMELQDRLEQEIRDRKIDAEIAAIEEVKRAEKQAQDEKEKQNRRAGKAWDSMTQDLKDTLGEQNALYKASATVNATIKTYEAANSAYAALAPIPYVGPALGAAAAGVAIAAGLANVAAINSARAQGGQVTAGTPYNVGERGMETFVPDTNGRIIPNHQLGGGAQGLNIKIFTYGNDKVTAKESANGELEIYVRKDELDDLMSGNLANVNSQSGSALNSTYNMQR